MVQYKTKFFLAFLCLYLVIISINTVSYALIMQKGVDQQIEEAAWQQLNTQGMLYQAINISQDKATFYLTDYAYGLYKGEKSWKSLIPMQIDTFLQKTNEELVNFTGLPPRHWMISLYYGNKKIKLWGSSYSYQKRETSKNNEESYFDKALKLEEKGDYREAVIQYNEEIKINPDNDAAWMNKGNALDSLGCTQEALKCYDKAININPKSGAWLNKGVTLSNMGKWKEAINAYKQNIKICPNDSWGWFLRGETEEKAGLTKDAIVSYKTFINMVNTNPPDQDFSQQVAMSQAKIEKLNRQETQKSKHK
ncbi:MAG: tetratricopeptide repeat protein [Candidatus Saganbacteria bacterium]|nr:tetratricopeptide repeat protein [Candidatus Saganbacteria bacterium]